jgi:hypothetical protein
MKTSLTIYLSIFVLFIICTPKYLFSQDLQVRNSKSDTTETLNLKINTLDTINNTAPFLSSDKNVINDSEILKSPINYNEPEKPNQVPVLSTKKETAIILEE